MQKHRVVIDVTRLEKIDVSFQMLKKRLEELHSNLHTVMIDISDPSVKATVESILAEVPDGYLLMKSESGKLVIFSPKTALIDRIERVKRSLLRASKHE